MAGPDPDHHTAVLAPDHGPAARTAQGHVIGRGHGQVQVGIGHGHAA